MKTIRKYAPEILIFISLVILTEVSVQMLVAALIK
jgi:hypothetical protein